MDDIAEQLAIRDRFRKKMIQRETPSERLRAMARLQQETWDALRSSPSGWAHFLRRNFKARAIDVRGSDAT
jgi:hypothetical protein